jgi:hypothetical protein
MTIETGALEQAYAKVETAYGVMPADTLSATDGIRHLELSLSSKKNREPSPEKRGTPDEAQSLPRRQSQNWNLSSIMWEPSGTPGTPSNVAKFLKAGLGGQTQPALVTTVAAAPAPTATGCDLTSAAGLAVGDLIVFNVGTGVAARREVTRIKTLASASITYDALSAAPEVPGAAVSGVNYQLANNITQSLAIYKYYNAGGFKQSAQGCVVDQIQISFDGTKEVGLAIQGPAGRWNDATFGTVQAKPGSHTTIGAPVGGLTGNLYLDGNAFLVIAAQVTINNALDLRNKELGTMWASGIAGRTAMRKIGVSVTFYLEDTRLIDWANNVTKGTVRLVVGNVNGSMVACVLPAVEFEIPDVGNEIAPKELTIEGVAYATNGNDQVFLGEA